MKNRGVVLLLSYINKNYIINLHRASLKLLAQCAYEI